MCVASRGYPAMDNVGSNLNELALSLIVSLNDYNY